MSPNVPPPYPRSPTGEIDALKATLEAFSVHLKGVSLELSAERDVRQKEKERGISILSIHVPLAVVLAVFGTLVVAAVAGGAYFHETKSHMSDAAIHADRTKAIQRDGIAYARDVKEAIESEASDRAAQVRRVERAVTKGAQCRPSKVHGEVTCSFQDPETLKLRPP